MALSNTTDPENARAELSEWLSRRWPDRDRLVVDNVVSPSSSGLSTETLLFDVSWNDNGTQRIEHLVARVAPTGSGIFPTYDLVREHRVLAALYRATDVPVPEVIGVETNPRFLGSSFLVMQRVDGKVAADDPPFTTTGWVMELPPDRRATLNDNALAALTKVHAVDWRALGLDQLDPRDAGETTLDAQIRHWRGVYDWAAEDQPNPTVEGGFAWLLKNRPAQEREPVLAWGDARLGNLLIGDDQTVNAVLDWEMVTLGAREMDLGWWLFILRHHTEGIGVGIPDGFPAREEVARRYQEMTGYAPRDLDYYEVFAAVRLSILMHRAGRFMIELGLLPAGAPMALSNPASHLLARLTGQPEPEATAQSFIGNRA